MSKVLIIGCGGVASVPGSKTNKKAQVPHQKVQTCAWKKAIFCAEKAPGQDVPEPRAAFQHDPKRRDDESLYSNSAFTALY